MSISIEDWQAQQTGPWKHEKGLIGEVEVTFTTYPNAHRTVDIDTSTPEKWAVTWICRQQDYFNHTPQVYIDDIRDWIADQYIGSLPWNPEQSKVVCGLIREHPMWKKLAVLLEERYPEAGFELNMRETDEFENPKE